jgi:hypothetical protein
MTSPSVLNLTVHSVLAESGYGPWLSGSTDARSFCGGFAAAVRLADTVANTISLKIPRLRFIADAAEELTEDVSVMALSKLTFAAHHIADSLEHERPTPHGSTEVWGSFLRAARALHDGHKEEAI